jgi:hypothetical protein
MRSSLDDLCITTNRISLVSASTPSKNYYCISLKVGPYLALLVITQACVGRDTKPLLAIQIVLGNPQTTAQSLTQKPIELIGVYQRSGAAQCVQFSPRLPKGAPPNAN